MFGLLFSVYVMSGLLDLLFTSQWWLVLLSILVLTLILSLPMIVVRKLYSYSFCRKKYNESWGDVGAVEFSADVCGLL